MLLQLDRTRVPVLAAAATLLALQVLYKLLSPVTTGLPVNPVVLSNLAIAAFHSATLVTLWRTMRA